MSHQPKLIPDPFEFARREDALRGELDARNLPRVQDVLRKTEEVQPVSYALRGYRLEGKSYLAVEASAELLMQCQRCLGDVRCTVEVDTRLLLVPRGEPLPDDELEDDDFDPVHAWRDFDVLAAVEEELLLALPLAPTHEDCSVPVAKGNGDDASPFAALRGFKASGGAKTDD